MTFKTLFFFLILVVCTKSQAQVTAPDFTLDDSQGNTRTLYQELDQGKIVVLDFFSTLCGTCQINTPVLEGIWNTFGYGGDSLWVWGIEAGNAQDSAINAFRSQYNVTFPCYSTYMDDVVLPMYHITYTPQYFVVCPDHYMKQYSVNDIVVGIQGCLPTQSELAGNVMSSAVWSAAGKIMVHTQKESFIEIYTIHGQPVYSGRVHSDGVQVIDMTPGIYIYLISSRNSEFVVGKVVVF